MIYVTLSPRPHAEKWRRHDLEGEFRFVPSHQSERWLSASRGSVLLRWSPTRILGRRPPTHHLHPRTTPLYNTLQQSQALRLAPSRCWPGQVCALRAPSAPQGPKQPRTLRCVKYTHPSARARQTPETIGNAASGDGGISMVHMGADGRWITAQCLHPERGRRLLLEERRNPLRLDRARCWNLRLLLLPVCTPGARHDSRRGGVGHHNTPIWTLGGLQWATEKDGTSTNASPAVFTLPPTRGSTRSTSRPSTTPLSAVVSRSTVRSAPPATLSPVSHGAHLSAP